MVDTKKLPATSEVELILEQYFYVVELPAIWNKKTNSDDTAVLRSVPRG